jgi:ABC-2 type transport system ATP-binding protein
MADLNAQARSPYRIRALNESALGTALASRGIPSTVDGTTVELPAMSEEDAADLLGALVADGVRVVAFESQGSSLESIYLSMTEERR